MKQSISHWGMHEVDESKVFLLEGSYSARWVGDTIGSYDAQYLHQANPQDIKQFQAAAQKFY